MLTAEQFVKKFKDVKTLPYVVTELNTSTEYIHRTQGSPC